MKRRLARLMVMAATAVAQVTPGSAQRASGADGQDAQPVVVVPSQSTPSPLLERQRGTVAGSTVGEAGRRQTRDQEIGGIKPLGRINSRIANRVQSRLRTRIDRNYDPQANAASPFEAASDQARTVTRPR